MGVLREIANFPRELVGSLKMNRTQAFVFATGWWCWVLGSMQFYLLPYTQTNLAKALNVEPAKIAEANTTSMLSRALGAVIFGILADQYGRKWPMIGNLVLIGVFTLCSGFVHTYGQLVGTRFLFGIAYGGLYGTNMATVLEAVPRKARGPVAGFTQQGFGAGNLLASGFHLAMNKYGWRSLYYLGAGLTPTAIVLRYFCPSYSVTEEAIRHTEGDATAVVDARAAVGGNLSFWVKFRYAITRHWPIFVYCTVLTACFNTLGHGHLDVYPSYLESQRGLSVLHETWITVTLQSGGILGGVFGGYMSRYSAKWVPFGFALALLPLLPALFMPKTWNTLAVGAFFFEFCYGAAIGTVGNILQMVCPHPGIRAAFGGVTYNLGNAISSIGPSIETKLGDDLPTKSGKPDYGKIILILGEVLIACLCITIAFMPIKDVNMEWDLEDPNQVIPAHEAPGKMVGSTGDEIEPAQDIERQTPPKGNRDIQHIEMDRVRE